MSTTQDANPMKLWHALLAMGAHGLVLAIFFYRGAIMSYGALLGAVVAGGVTFVLGFIFGRHSQ